MSKEADRAIVVAMIELHIKYRCEAYGKEESTKARIEGELTTMIDLSHLFGAITIEEQRHYKERLMKIQEREHEAWLESNLRIG